MSDDKREYYSTIIQNSSLQLLRVIDDILEISTLGTKQVKPKPEKVCVNDLLNELYSIFNIKVQEAGKITLRLSKSLPDTDSTIITDKNKLHKILSNLIENAIKFTPEGYVELGYGIKNNKIELYVLDTGIGISPQSLNRIFDRFVQEDKELSGNLGGLGLGLAIAKENTIVLGGTISVDSEKGKGTTFTVSLPY